MSIDKYYLTLLSLIYNLQSCRIIPTKSDNPEGCGIHGTQLFIEVQIFLCLPAKLLQLCLTLFVNLCTVARQAPLSMGFSRQECWGGLPFLPSGDLPDLAIEPAPRVSLVLAGGFFTAEPPKKPNLYPYLLSKLDIRQL